MNLIHSHVLDQNDIRDIYESVHHNKESNAHVHRIHHSVINNGLRTHGLDELIPLSLKKSFPYMI